MWYGGCQCDDVNSSGCCDRQFLMYANSSDGIAWEKPNLGRFDATPYFPGIPKAKAKANNIIMYGGGLGIYRDRHEADPSKRFKIAGGAPGWNVPGRCGASICRCDGQPGWPQECAVATGASPDGIQGWREVQALNVADPVAICPGSPSPGR